tara:strand:- start:18539 stop:18799 length:261 start_codon:yes stop_codon:yes gene_type:complete
MPTAYELSNTDLNIRLDEIEEVVYDIDLGFGYLIPEFVRLFNLYMDGHCASNWEAVSKLNHEARFLFNVLVYEITEMEKEMGIEVD